MECWIYKGTRREETYLYLAEPDDLSRVPRELLDALGPLELVMSLTLTPERRLARASVEQVRRALDQRGFYLQLPPMDMPGQGRIQ